MEMMKAELGFVCVGSGLIPNGSVLFHSSGLLSTGEEPDYTCQGRVKKEFR
jgi:hypothetical protein